MTTLQNSIHGPTLRALKRCPFPTGTRRRNLYSVSSCLEEATNSSSWSAHQLGYISVHRERILSMWKIYLASIERLRRPKLSRAQSVAAAWCAVTLERQVLQVPITVSLGGNDAGYMQSFQFSNCGSFKKRERHVWKGKKFCRSIKWLRHR